MLMRKPFVFVVLCAVGCMSFVGADAEQALGVKDWTQPVSNTEEASSASGAEARVNQSIDIDLIDLDSLREMVALSGKSSVIRMTLDDCVRIALEQNPDILSACE